MLLEQRLDDLRAYIIPAKEYLEAQGKTKKTAAIFKNLVPYVGSLSVTERALGLI